MIYTDTVYLPFLLDMNNNRQLLVDDDLNLKTILHLDIKLINGSSGDGYKIQCFNMGGYEEGSTFQYLYADSNGNIDYSSDYLTVCPENYGSVMLDYFAGNSNGSMIGSISYIPRDYKELSSSVGVFNNSDFNNIPAQINSVISLALPLFVGVFILLMGVSIAKKVFNYFNIRS